MKKLATAVPVLAAMAVAAFLVPHQALAGTDPHPGPSASGSHSPWATPSGSHHTGPGASATPGPGGSASANGSPAPSTSPSPSGSPGAGGPGWSDHPGWPGWPGDPGWPGGPGPGPGDNGGGGTQPGGWHNPGGHLPGCGTARLIVDGGFERPRLPAHTGYKLYDQVMVPGWRTDDPAGVIEIWNGARMGVPAVDGRQLAEINATGGSDSLYQDIRTVPGTMLTWSFNIRARNAVAGAPDVDTTQIHFAASPRAGQGGAQAVGGAFSYRNSSDDTHWKTLYGFYQVPDGQTWTRVSLTSISHTGPTGYGNLVDRVNVTGTRC